MTSFADDFMGMTTTDKVEFLSARLPAFEKEILARIVSAESSTLESLLETDNMTSSSLKFMIMKLIATKSTDICHAAWLSIFSELSTELVKGIAKEGVEHMGEESSQKLSLVYGEVDFFSFANILERAAPKQGEVFVDLGHGTGKGLICAALLYGPLLSKCYGVEIVPELNNISIETKRRYEDEILTQPMFEHHRSCEIVVEEGDLLAEQFRHWTEADIVFVNSTCFDEDLMKAMAAVAESMKPGARIITLTKQLPSNEFTLLDRRQYVMSWGEATSFMSIRKSID